MEGATQKKEDDKTDDRDRGEKSTSSTSEPDPSKTTPVEGTI
jgi:hypothetical protein